MSISPYQYPVGARPLPMCIPAGIKPPNSYTPNLPVPRIQALPHLPILPTQMALPGQSSSKNGADQPAFPRMMPPVSSQPITKSFLPSTDYPIGIWAGGIAASALTVAGLIFGYKKYKNNTSNSDANNGKNGNVSNEESSSTSSAKTKRTIQYDAKSAYDIPADKNFARLNKEIKCKDFSGEDLRNANFKGIKLTHCNFDNAKLDGANFEGADVSGCSFQDSAKGFALSPKGLNAKQAIFYETWPIMADASTQGVRKIFASREEYPGDHLSPPVNSSHPSEKKADLFPEPDQNDEKVFNVTAKTFYRERNEAVKSFAHTIKKRIEGQDLAIDELKGLLKMAYIMNLQRFQKREEKGAPRLIVCLAGPSGVGKTETIQQLARKFNREVIMLNGGDYSTKVHTTKILGSGPGWAGNNDRTVANDIIDACEKAKKEKKSPPIILIDEIDKADPEFFRIWNNILEQGNLESRHTADHDLKTPPKKVDFSGVDIFVTSNFGQHQIREFLQGKTALTEDDKRQMEDIIKDVSLLEKGVQPDFWARFNAVIPYSNLPKETVEKLTRLKIQKEVEDMYLSRGFQLDVDEAVIRKVTKAGFSLTEGCRAIDNAVDKYINAPLADAVEDLVDCGRHKQDFGGSSGDIIRLTLTKQGDIVPTITHNESTKQNKAEKKPVGILRTIIPSKDEETLSDILESMSSLKDEKQFALLHKRYNKIRNDYTELRKRAPKTLELQEKIMQGNESKIDSILKTMTSKEKTDAQKFIKTLKEYRDFTKRLNKDQKTKSYLFNQLEAHYKSNPNG